MQQVEIGPFRSDSAVVAFTLQYRNAGTGRPISIPIEQNQMRLGML
jgi:hypothetical protein